MTKANDNALPRPEIGEVEGVYDQDRVCFPEGVVLFTCPRNLSDDTVADLEAWWALRIRSLRRRACKCSEVAWLRDALAWHSTELAKLEAATPPKTTSGPSQEGADGSAAP